MPKKYEISREAQVLLKLLRIALGTEPTAEDGKRLELFPENIDWQEVIRLSYEQKVPALAVDGLKASGYDPREGKSGRQLEELNAVLTPWFEDVKNSEESYAYYLTILTTLCQIFSTNGLKPVILKGYGLGRDYPIPSHRGAGDIDIFALDENNKLATESALDIIENQLKIQTKKVPHDYEFTFKGLEVELHYDATNPYFGTKQERYITSRLTQMLPQGIIPCPGIPGAYLPSADFNALYLIRHSFGHFYSASGNLRQCADWVTFLRANHSAIDWQALGTELDRSNMKPFFDGFNTMLGRWLRLDKSFCPIAEYNIRTEQFLINDIKRTIPRGVNLPQYVRCLYFKRKKLKFMSGKSWLYILVCTILSIVNNKIYNMIK